MHIQFLHIQLPSDRFKKSTQFCPIVCLTGLLLATTLISGCGINNISTLDQAVNERWAVVYNQYELQTQLVPELIGAVEDLASQERVSLTQVIETHKRVLQMNISPQMLTTPESFQRFNKNQSALTSALRELMNIVQTDPEISSEEHFKSLRTRLADAQRDITVARRGYIDAVQQFNTELRAIPGRWWAGFLYPHMQPMTGFTSMLP